MGSAAILPVPGVITAPQSTQQIGLCDEPMGEWMCAITFSNLSREEIKHQSWLTVSMVVEWQILSNEKKKRKLVVHPRWGIAFTTANMWEILGRVAWPWNYRSASSPCCSTPWRGDKKYCMFHHEKVRVAWFIRPKKLHHSRIQSFTTKWLTIAITP